MERRAKIVCTVGPASCDDATVQALIEAGIDVVRLNLSHGRREQHREWIGRVRHWSRRKGRFVAVLVDLMGPRFRLGRFDGERKLEEDETFTLGEGDVDVPMQDARIVQTLRRGDRVLIDNGLIETRVERRRGGKVWLKVVSGGVVSERKGINLPDSELPFEVSRKDRLDIQMAIDEQADYLAVSYVGEAADVDAVRRIVRRRKGDIPLVAKLERARAVDHLDEIVAASDAVMVARGDLGVEMEPHQVPVLQKRMIESGWRQGKPVIVATQMLESMMHHPRPTRAEASDVANAVFDGTDAVMLSGETAMGQYPVESVEMMDRIVREAEQLQRRGLKDSFAGSLRRRPAYFDVEPPPRPGSQPIPETIAWAAVVGAKRLAAKYIVVLSQGGFTARMLAGRRPSTPVVALSQLEQTGRRMQLVWGVIPVLMRGEVRHLDDVVGLIDRHLIEAGLAQPNDEIAILAGDPIQERPPTNLLRLHRVRAVAR